MWRWIVLLGFFNDIFLAEKIGPNILFFVLSAYLISFVSKSFMIERRWSGFLLVVIFILVGNFMGSIFNILFINSNMFSEVLLYTIKDYFINWNTFIVANIISGISFFIIYTFVNKIEKYIARSENRLNISF
jgi:cell shape-determining protein MreD